MSPLGRSATKKTFVLFYIICSRLFVNTMLFIVAIDMARCELETDLYSLKDTSDRKCYSVAG